MTDKSNDKEPMRDESEENVPRTDHTQATDGNHPVPSANDAAGGAAANANPNATGASAKS